MPFPATASEVYFLWAVIASVKAFTRESLKQAHCDYIVITYKIYNISEGTDSNGKVELVKCVICN